MPLPPDQKRRFDEAAKQAEIEFNTHYKGWTALDACKWMERWYEQAAYDRLCRIMRRANLS
jgi:hypothetical protein